MLTPDDKEIFLDLTGRIASATATAITEAIAHPPTETTSRIEAIIFDLDNTLIDGYRNWYPGVEDLLTEVNRKGIATAIATSAGRGWVEMANRELRIGEYIPAAFHRSPQYMGSKMVQVAAARRYTGNRQNTLVVGDDISDIEAAKANGLASAGVLWGSMPLPDLLNEAGADTLFDTPGDLQRLLSVAS